MVLSALLVLLLLRPELNSESLYQRIVQHSLVLRVLHHISTDADLGQHALMQTVQPVTIATCVMQQ